MTNKTILVNRIASIIGFGAKGKKLAIKLVKCGVRNRADLRKPDILIQLSRESQSNVLFNPIKNATLATVQKIITEVKRRFIPDMPLLVVGSARRLSSHIKDIDFLIVSETGILPPIQLRQLQKGDLVSIVDIYASGPLRQSVILQVKDHAKSKTQNYRSDFFITTPKSKPFALYHFTGSKQFNIRTRAYVKKRGWLLNQYGIFNIQSRREVKGTNLIHSERDIAKFLGITYHPPWDRIR